MNQKAEKGMQGDFNRCREETDLLLLSPDVISRRQLTRMIYVEGFGTAGLTYPAVAAWCGPGEGGLAFLGYGIFLLIFTSWMLWLAKYRIIQAGTVFCTAAEFSKNRKRLPYWAAVLYILRFFINSIALFYFFGLSVQEVYMPDNSLWWLLLPFGFLLWYCAGTTLQKHARFLELLFPWIALLFAVLIVAAGAGIITKVHGAGDISELFHQNASVRTPSGYSGVMWNIPSKLWDVIRGGYFLLLCSTPLEFMIFLIPSCVSLYKKAEKTPEKMSRTSWRQVRSCVIRGVLGGFLCNLLLWFVTVKTLGRTLTASTPWSVIKIMQLIHLPGGFLERFDILLAVYWVLCLIGVLSGYLYYGRRIAEETYLHRMSAQNRRRKVAAGTAFVVLGIYLAACLFRDSDKMFILYGNYKKWMDFPLIIAVPLLVEMMKYQRKSDNRNRMGEKKQAVGRKRSDYGKKRKTEKQLCKPEKKPMGKIRKRFLITTAMLMVSASLIGCGKQKQSDAEKKKYILSLYLESEGNGYACQAAYADLVKTNEREEWIPCQIKKVQVANIAEMEQRYKETEVGQPEWNHIYTIIVGPNLAGNPEKLLSFLQEWDESWQKSPNVSVCMCDVSADELYNNKEFPDGTMGQRLEDLIDQEERPGKVCRTPIDILKKYNEGKQSIVVYQAEEEEGEWKVLDRVYKF